MTLRPALCALALGLCPLAAPALTLEFPAPATATADESSAADVARLPMAPFDGTAVALLEREGPVTRQAWRLAAGRMTTLQILKPLRDQLRRDGFRVVFECQDTGCGGYDFRFAADVLGEPAMHVDLGDFRYLLAENAQSVTVALLVSRSPSSGFVQMTRVGGDVPLREVVVTSTKSTGFTAAPPGGAALDGLLDLGHAPLDDLAFQTGSADLADDGTASLAALAAFLAGNPDRRVTLVGHTDAEGGLAGNVALSRQRAEAVRRALVTRHGADAGRIDAQGVGYLAPRASNATDDGRRANRRVEVVLN